MYLQIRNFALASIVTIGSIHFASAKENVGSPGNGNSGGGSPHRIAASCAASTSRKDLDINNVRTPIFINGDMWWDLSGNAQYEIPKDSRKYSLFSGALWIGGKDAAGNLKVAAQT